ncbi:MAG: PSD1 domain-containing protein [Planctomycetales bacterium]|nr:PSD1 domain-containing protein [Planctomycetales bacterium]
MITSSGMTIANSSNNQVPESETMKNPVTIFETVLALTLAFFASSVTNECCAQELDPEQVKFFETKIRPVLIKECYGCHSNQSGNVRGGLRLDTKTLTHIGGSSGPAIVPGNLDESLLYNAITHQDFIMPPKRQLPAAVIDDFRTWIEMGAPDPRTSDTVVIRSTISDEDIQQARATFWAYQPPATSPLPQVEHSAWPKNSIDYFVLNKLEQAELPPAADALPHQVLRRLCFDIVGLPPTPEQIEYFEKLWSKDNDVAISHVVDSLLDNAQYGERWGRHWLDVVRYAESTGREVNMTFPHAWRFRDYVIDSFNADKPFDTFVQEQIAGDLLPAPSDEKWAENLIATTFLAMGPKNINEQNRVQFAADLADEQIDATTRVFLGMSVACARCHDHKFDAIPQADYYALAGVFSNITTYFGTPPSEFGTFATPQQKRGSSLLLLPIEDPNPYDKRYTAKELEDLRSQIRNGVQDLSQLQPRRADASGNAAQSQRQRIATLNRLSGLSNKLAVVDENGNPRSYCMGVQERDAPRDLPVLVRGEIDQRGPTVKRGFPRVLCSTPVKIDRDDSGRLELARWIGSSENTLTARVMVNRIWQHLIGQGLVTSTENFGVTGQPPSHLELLDYLALRFIESGWSVKAVVREIAASRTYRISSQFDQASHELDPDNALLWRANPRRLDAEAIRDAMLSISGELELQRPRGSEVAKAGYTRVRDGVLGDPRDTVRRVSEEVANMARGQLANRFRSGSGFFPGGRGRASVNAREAAMAEIARKMTNQLDMEDAKFRSVYLPMVRNEIPRALEVFDFADANSIVGTREISHTANQALFMLNNPFVIQQSAVFAKRLAEQSSRLAGQIDNAFILAYGRPPTDDERAAASSFLKNNAPRGRSRADIDQALAGLCQSLFASAEFRLIE